VTRKPTWVAAIALSLLALAGCGGGDSGGGSGGQATAGSSSAGASSGSAAALATADSSLGSIVVDGKGRTVYVFDKDTADSGASACTGECLANWPAVTAESDSPAVDGVTGHVGTITRDDGTRQMTLNGLPLYTFVGDSAAGDTTGQGKQGIWWVVAADGTKIAGEPPAPGGY
jgi:predicted lipoprotein with Yx(FWY)xxD motif